MTKKETQSKRVVSLFFLLMTGFAVGCAKPGSSTVSQDVNFDAGVIGGAPVEQSQSAQEFEKKVLYLAMKVEKTSNTVTWNGHCTASAISPRVILTAAHCVEGMNPQDLSIVLTKNPATTPYNEKEWYPVVSFRQHEGYTGQDGFHNDLALILIDRALPSDRIAKLASPSQLSLPLDFVVVGYGTTSESSDPDEIGSHASLLNFVEKSIDNFDVNAETFHINQNDHKGFCSGDSGGPGLVYDSRTHEHFILGVVSNVSMLNERKKMLDPHNQYSLCIGEGNYMNVLYPQLRQWIETNHKQILAQK